MTKPKIIEVNIGGIKCDNTLCDYNDDSVMLSQYMEYLNKPCPKCGCNLLTESDMNVVIVTIKIARFFNKYFFWLGYFGKKHYYDGKMDGTGKVKFIKK